LAKAKKKANRLKCANKLGQQAKAHTGFSADAGQFLWNLQDREVLDAYASDHRSKGQVSSHFLTWPYDGYSDHRIRNTVQAGFRYHREWHIGQVMLMYTVPGIRRSLENSGSLLSPCDPMAKTDNQRDRTAGTLDGGAWGATHIVGGSYGVHMNAGSYGIHMGGDAQNGSTLLGFTKNVAGQDPHAAWSELPSGYWKPYPDYYYGYNNIRLEADSNARWIGGNGRVADNSYTTRYPMYWWGDAEQGRCSKLSGLDANQGQFSKADASVKQGDDATFLEAISTHNALQDTVGKEYNGGRVTAARHATVFVRW